MQCKCHGTLVHCLGAESRKPSLHRPKRNTDATSSRAFPTQDPGLVESTGAQAGEVQGHLCMIDVFILERYSVTVWFSRYFQHDVEKGSVAQKRLSSWPCKDPQSPE